jgi:GH25 family lysozyme M1 (1,4-beta-N-acetylmuramidase)
VTINVIDTGTSQAGLDFTCAAASGWSSAYVKLGGDNSGRYVAPHYVDEVDRARAAGMRVGHYWVPNNSMDPAGAANYFVNNLRGWTSGDYAVLDNESLDGAGRYSDAQAAAWIRQVQQRLGISGRQIKHYSGLADARETNWPDVLATGAQFIIAAYSYDPLALPEIPTVPADRIDGHQYSSSGAVCGVTCDRNAFVDDAFDYQPPTPTGEEMPERTTAIDRRTRELEKGVWQTLYMNEESTAASIATGRCRGMSTAVVVCEGLPVGAEVQFRLLKTKSGSSEDRGGTGARDASATGGSSYATISDNFELTKDDDGIRWQYAVQHDGVTVTKTEVATLIWRS